jgi:hypothetical protein
MLQFSRRKLLQLPHENAEIYQVGNDHKEKCGIILKSKLEWD